MSAAASTNIHFVKKLVKKAFHHAVCYTLVAHASLRPRPARATRKAVYEILHAHPPHRAARFDREFLFAALHYGYFRNIESVVDAARAARTRRSAPDGRAAGTPRSADATSSSGCPRSTATSPSA